MRTEDLDQMMVIGVCPYGDGSGYRYSVKVERKDGGRTIQISDAGMSVSIDDEHWGFVRDAIVRAINATNVVGDDR